MLPQELKELIDRYCMGAEPTDAQMNEIMDLMLSLDADAEEATKYMQERIAGPTLEELQAKENAKPANYDVILDNSGPAKLLMVKAIIDITKLPLDKAKSLMDNTPNFPVVNITYAEAEEFVERVNKIARSKGYEFLIPPTDWQWLGYQKKCAERYKHLDKDIIRAGASVFAWSEATSGGHLHNVGELQPLEGIYDSTGLVYEMGQTKKYNCYRYGAFNEPLKNVFGGESSELMYVNKRYDNLGLRLICME